MDRLAKFQPRVTVMAMALVVARARVQFVG